MEHLLQQHSALNPTPQTQIWITCTYYGIPVRAVSNCLIIPSSIQNYAPPTRHQLSLHQAFTEINPIVKVVESRPYRAPHANLYVGQTDSHLIQRYFEYIRYTTSLVGYWSVSDY